MERDFQQNIETEKVAEPLVAESTNAAQEMMESRKPKATVAAPSRDQGDWKYKPWAGRDHWVHALTGDTTFDLSKVK